MRRRVHWVVVELDAHGEIDAHAAMCLRQAIGQAPAGAIGMVLVDLRDLTAINAAGVALLTTHQARCQAHGIDLGLLIRGGGGHDQVAEALVRAGLGHALHYAADRHPPATGPPVRQLDGGRGVVGGRLDARPGASRPAARAAQGPRDAGFPQTRPGPGRNV